MASYSVSRSKNATLSGATADTVALTQRWDSVRVYNRSTVDLWVLPGSSTYSGTITAGGDNVLYVAPSEWVEFDYPGDGTVQVIGASNAYSVEGVSAENGRA